MTDLLHDLSDFLDQRFSDRVNRKDVSEAEVLDALFEWIDSRSWSSFSVTYHADGTVTHTDDR